MEVPFGSKKEIGVVWKVFILSQKILKLKTTITNYSLNRKLVDFIEWFQFII